MANRFTPDVRSIINDAWNRLMASVGVRATDFVLADTINEIDDRQDLAEERLASGEDRLDVVENITGTGTVPLETSAAMTLYVDAAGSDSNDGSLAHPFLTIQKAVDMVPKRIRHPVAINVGAGTFDGALVTGFIIEKNPAVGSWLLLKGTLAALAPTTGPTSGTATAFVNGSGNTWSTVTLAGAGWTVNDLKNKLFVVTGGGGYNATDPSNNVWPIYANTADTITLPAVSTSFSLTTTFELKDWGTIINNTVGPGIYAPGTEASTTKCSLILDGNSAAGNNFFTPFNIQFLKTMGGAGATVSSSYGIYTNNALVSIKGCRLEESMVPVGGSGQYSGFTVYVMRSAIVCSNATSANRLYLSSNGYLLIGNCTYTAYGRGADVYGGQLNCSSSSFEMLATTGGFYSSQRMGFNNCKIYSPKAAAISAKGFTPIQIGNGQLITISYLDISNSLKAIDLVGPSTALQARYLIGTGNTTVASIATGASAYFDSNSTITGATEISIDGVAKTFAEMRAGTPKYLTNATTGTRVWGD